MCEYLLAWCVNQKINDATVLFKLMNLKQLLKNHFIVFFVVKDEEHIYYIIKCLDD